MKYDFWYSEKQKDIIEGLSFPEKYHVTINGMEYTECTNHSKGLKSNWDDAVFLGTFDDSEIVITKN